MHNHEEHEEECLSKTIGRLKQNSKKFMSAKPLIFNGQLKEEPGLYAYDLQALAN
jgi:hypothetical protein